MKPPCIIMVSLILPSLRAIIARKLIDEYDLNRAEAAKRVQLTRAAITQYCKGVRGSSALELLESLEASKALISEMVKDLAEGNYNTLSAIKKLCELCRILRKKRLLCRYCAEIMPGLDVDQCDLCL